MGTCKRWWYTGREAWQLPESERPRGCLTSIAMEYQIEQNDGSILTGWCECCPPPDICTAEKFDARQQRIKETANGNV